MDCSETNNMSVDIQFDKNISEMRSKLRAYFGDSEFLNFLTDQEVKYSDPEIILTIFQADLTIELGWYFLDLKKETLDWVLWEFIVISDVTYPIRWYRKNRNAVQVDWKTIFDTDLLEYRRQCARTNVVLSEIYNKLDILWTQYQNKKKITW